MARNSVGTWDGGFIREDAAGHRFYWIRRMVGGKRFEVNTRATTTKAAIKQLERFEAAPESYEPGGGQSGEPVKLDDDLATLFLTWSSEVKHNSKKWVGQQGEYLTWWSGVLGDRDLRRLDLARDILPSLLGAPARVHKIAVLKVFFSWLVKEKRLLTAAQDPTFRTLDVPQARPEQWTRSKAFGQEQFTETRNRLETYWRDAIDILAGTGWHVSELTRFAHKGAVQDHPSGKGRRVLLCPQTKGGEPLRTEVSDGVASAGERLLHQQSFSPDRFAKAVKRASRGAFTVGQFRHAVATWAINAGTDPGQVAAFLNHKSPRTTRKFYATHAVAKKIPTLL